MIELCVTKVGLVIETKKLPQLSIVALIPPTELDKMEIPTNGGKWKYKVYLEDF